MERECAWRAASRSSAVFFAHPNYGLPCVLSGLWDEALVFGGTEVAPTFGGFLEGALEAASWAPQSIVPLLCAAYCGGPRAVEL